MKDWTEGRYAKDMWRTGRNTSEARRKDKLRSKSGSLRRRRSLHWMMEDQEEGGKSRDLSCEQLGREAVEKVERRS